LFEIQRDEDIVGANDEMGAGDEGPCDIVRSNAVRLLDSLRRLEDEDRKTIEIVLKGSKALGMLERKLDALAKRAHRGRRGRRVEFPEEHRFAISLVGCFAGFVGKPSVKEPWEDEHKRRPLEKFALAVLANKIELELALDFRLRDAAKLYRGMKDVIPPDEPKRKSHRKVVKMPTAKPRTPEKRGR